MKIFLGTDHAGFELKEAVKEFLISKKYDVEILDYTFVYDENLFYDANHLNEEGRIRFSRSVANAIQ